MALFTVIFEYAGGTYVEQVGAATVQEAGRAWIAAIAAQDVFEGSTAGILRSVDEALEDGDPVELNGCPGVYYFQLSRWNAWGHFIETRARKLELVTPSV